MQWLPYLQVHTDPDDSNVRLQFLDWLLDDKDLDFFNLKYLLAIVCLIFQHVVESYQFKFRYTDQGPQMEILR